MQDVNREMEEFMSSEISILALYGLVVIVTLLVQTLAATSQFGLGSLAGNRGDLPEAIGVVGRCDRALNNSVVAMALFAPAILVLSTKGTFTPGTLLAAQIFLIARIAYVVIYIAGIPWLRTAVWMLGFLATAYLYILAL